MSDLFLFCNGIQTVERDHTFSICATDEDLVDFNVYFLIMLDQEWFICVVS